jgi:hypothetical protein
MKTTTGTIVKVIYLGIDYGKVEVTFPSGHVDEYEIALGLAKVLAKVDNEIIA